jgi:hypothetical protein
VAVTSVYDSPEEFGLECVGQVSWDSPSWFDLTVVWIGSTGGRLYWADDEGCSCPRPFEYVESIEKLQTGSLQQLAEHLSERRDRSSEPGAAADVVELLARADRMTGR